MNHIILPIVILVALLGIQSRATVGGRQIPSRPNLVLIAQASQFIAYRNAVVAYVTANPTFVGSVPATLLSVAPGFGLQPGEGNQVVATAGGSGRIIYAWAAIPGAAGQAVAVTGGDLSLGTVSGNTWVSPIGGVMGTLGVTITNGDVVSVLQIGV